MSTESKYNVPASQYNAIWDDIKRLGRVRKLQQTMRLSEHIVPVQQPVQLLYHGVSTSSSKPRGYTNFSRLSITLYDSTKPFFSTRPAA